MGKTMAEKILSSHAGKEVSAGEVAICEVDFCMSQDGTSQMVIEELNNLGAERLFAGGKRYAMVIDHNAPSPLMAVSDIHAKMRKYCREKGCLLYDIGEGICHGLMPERGHAIPGGLVIGADSHTVTYGAVNCASTGMGSTDVAAAVFTGKLWFRVPESMKFRLEGEWPVGVFSKDAMLHMVGDVGADGATYLSAEYVGPAIAALDMDARFTISNMAVEMGAKFGLMEVDEKTIKWLKGRTRKRLHPVVSDEDAEYVDVREYDVSKMVPLVARPHRVDTVSPVEEVEGTPIQQGLVGTCTGGRLEDLRVTAEILKGKHVHPDCRLIINPTSKEHFLAGMKKRYVQTIIEAGGVFVTPGCGPCVGTHNGVPSSGETVITAANRNFKGRMGNPNDVNIYLGSAATVAASVLNAKITDPRRYLR